MKIVSVEMKRRTCLRLVQQVLGKTSFVIRGPFTTNGVSTWIAGAGNATVAEATGLDSLEEKLRRWVEDVARAREPRCL